MKNIVRVFGSIMLVLCTFLVSEVPAEAYSVKEGDTLEKISKEYGISVETLLIWNPEIEDKNLIFPGQEINTGDDFYHRVELSAKDKQAIISLFDVNYYRESNKDVVAIVGTSEDALLDHYLTYGFWETRQPNENFNVNAYASAYDDLREAFSNKNLGLMVKNLVLHYVNVGKNEGRNITTIAACLSIGKDVLYYGAYDDDSSAWEEEHIVAKREEQSLSPSEPETPSQPTNTKMSVVDKMWQEKLEELLYVYNFLDENNMLDDFPEYRDAYLPASTTDNSAIAGWCEIRDDSYDAISSATIPLGYQYGIFNHYFDSYPSELSEAVFGVMSCTTTEEVIEYLLQSDYQELYEYGLSIDANADVDTAIEGIFDAIPSDVLSYCCG